MLIGLYSSRILLKYLGIDEYGVYNVVGSVVMMFSSIRGLFVTATRRFLNYHFGKGDEEILRSVFSASICIHVLLCVVFLLIVEPVGLYFINCKLQFSGVSIFVINTLFQLSVISSLMVIMTVPYDAVILANQKMQVYAYISVLETILKLGAAFALMFFAQGKLLIYGFLILAISIVIRAISVIYCRRYAYVRFTARFNRTTLRDMVKFAGWSFFGNLTFSLSNEGQNLLLNMYFGPVANAARGIAYQVRNAFYQLTTNLDLAFAPEITHSYARGEMKRMTEISTMQLRSSVYVIGLLLIPVYIYIDDILTVWLTAVPPYTADIIRCLLVLVLIRPFSLTCDTIFQATARLKIYQLVSALITGGGLVASIIYLHYTQNLLGVFWIYNIAAGINVIKSYVLLFLHRDIEFSDFVKATILTIASVAAMSLSAYLLLLLGNKLTLTWWTILPIIIGVNVMMVYTLFLTKSERRFINGIAAKIFKKSKSNR